MDHEFNVRMWPCRVKWKKKSCMLISVICSGNILQTFEGVTGVIFIVIELYNSSKTIHAHWRTLFCLLAIKLVSCSKTLNQKILLWIFSLLQRPMFPSTFILSLPCFFHFLFFTVINFLHQFVVFAPLDVNFYSQSLIFSTPTFSYILKQIAML